jgi:CheY-like chemotaxis protein
MLDRIFDPFDQLDPSNTRRHGGSGLGLAICRSLAQMMGGEITVASEVGQGSRFTLKLPLERVERPVESAREEAPDLRRQTVRPLKVLAAEDNPMNQLVLSTLMGAAGLQPHIVANGEEAVAAWRREPWDLILMDVQMPVMDGLDATRLIRDAEAAEGRPRTPMIALTANAMHHQIEEYRACGLDAVVSKPIDIRTLLTAIDALIAPGEQPARRARAAQPVPAMRRTRAPNTLT